MMNLELKHWAILAGLTTGVVTMLLTAQHSAWLIGTPGFVAGVVIQILSTITAIFVEPPRAAVESEPTNKRANRADQSTRSMFSAAIDLGHVDPKRFVQPAAD
jgi:hypothetical protein